MDALAPSWGWSTAVRRALSGKFQDFLFYFFKDTFWGLPKGVTAVA